MAKALTVKRVEKLLRAGTPGKHTDGEVRGLMLVIENPTSAHWLLRYQRNHKTKHMGLGGAKDVPLASARAKARRAREQIVDGIDPLVVKRASRESQREAEAKRRTFRQAAMACYASLKAGWTNQRHSDAFLSSLERHAFPLIGNLDIAAVDKDAVLRVLE
jgi:Arm DNA-binding domain